jgi:transcription initiation factor TFIIIB Brf1 subunit/transcription initiation factor TFIIB
VKLHQIEKDFSSHKKGVGLAFNKVKDELTEHLDAINQNTNELSTMQQYIAELELKIEKLSERVDELVASKQSAISYDINSSLTLREQEVFLALYTADSKKTATEIAQYLGLTDVLIHNYIYKLISKGIPIEKEYSSKGNMTLYVLNSHFKDVQARKNIVVINESVLEEMNLKERISQ